MLASSSGRVPANTSFEANQDINDRFHSSVAYFSHHRTEIPERLKHLDREWDIERALAAGASGLTIAGLVMGMLGRPRGFLLSLGVQGSYLQHTLQGWCPPLAALRRAGFRTATEIEREKCALKDMLRDFDPDSASGDGTELYELTVDLIEVR